jgi:hypothetical protein
MAAPELRSVRAGDLTLAYRELGARPPVRGPNLELTRYSPGLP